MEIIDTKLAGVKIVKSNVFGDERGFFVESFAQDRYKQAERRAVASMEFLQDY